MPGLPADFRTAWNRTGSRIPSEHERFVADVYEEKDRFAEDLFYGDASAGAYLLDKSDGGIRFAVADPKGQALADTAADAGPSLSACVRCHGGSRDWTFPIAR